MKKVRLLWFVSLLLSALFVTINSIFFPIREIIALEFSTSTQVLHHYIMRIAATPGESYHILTMNTLVDFGFLVAYSLLTYFSFRQILDVFQLRMAGWVYVLSFGAGFLDIVENIFLLLSGVQQQPIYSVTFSWAVRLKWAFAIVPILVIPIVLVFVLVIVLRSKQNDVANQVPG